MTFGERMKDLLDQGAQAATRAGEKGWEASKDLVTRAGAKAQELTEIGMLKLEIHQLESQAQKHIARLGTEAYEAFAERGVKTITRDTPAIKTILAEIARIREDIEKRETDLKNRKN
ncbi:hypothetical protein AGMMS49928_08090 [Spirochaetia bacterium]|nr:hypothetical protein AGMMS49928_08090 [Spirochaetia bacterium]